MKNISDINKHHWNDVFSLNLSSPFYDVDAIRAGTSSLSDVEILELPPVIEKRGLHLQCGIGLDTISLAKEGAKMTAIDFSEKAINFARELAAELNSSIDFQVADVLDSTLLEGEQYDFVYSSHGVLRWLPTLVPWAANIARLLKPGGFFYLFEIHPLVYRLKSMSCDGVELSGNYFDESPIIKLAKNTHIGSLPKEMTTRMAHVNWKLDSVLNSIIQANLQIIFFHEHIGTSYSRKGILSKKQGGLWYPENNISPIPLAYSILAKHY